MTARSILIVDDDERNRKLVRDVLQADGIPTLEARDGEEALALAAAHLPAVILLDVRLPDIDGAEVVRRLKAEPATRDIPVVAVTALAGAGAELIAAGFDAVLEKPIDVVELPGRVRSLPAAQGEAGLPGNREGATLDDARYE
jgi:two-component system, cell cycle response regulator DivK